eukprot:scaffold39028_cov65-Phaeocystis_antarctica.AAC.6
MGTARVDSPDDSGQEGPRFWTADSQPGDLRRRACGCGRDPPEAQAWWGSQPQPCEAVRILEKKLSSARED